MNEQDFIAIWEKKTIKQIEKEIKSWRAFFQKNSSAYAWHGRGITPPGSMPDGDKISVLKEILERKQKEQDGCASGVKMTLEAVK